MINDSIRSKARVKNVKFWEIADALSISEATLTRKLRRELPDAEREKLLRIIEEIAQRKEAENRE